MGLFRSQKVSLAKTAGFVPVNTKPEMFSNEVTNAVLRAHPYLSQFAMSLEVQQQDQLGSTIMASMVVSMPTPPVGANPAAVTQGKKGITIPIIVKDGKMFTPDVYIDQEDKVFPLTEERVAEVFADGSTMVVGENMNPNNISQAYAKMYGEDPTQQYGGFSNSPMRGKYASHGGLLAYLIDDTARNDLFRKFRKDPALSKTASDSTLLVDVLSKLASAPKSGKKKQNRVAASVLCGTKVAGKYNLLTISEEPHVVRNIQLSQDEIDAVPKLAKIAKLNKSVLMGPLPGTNGPTRFNTTAVILADENIDTTGRYKVTSTISNEKLAASVYCGNKHLNGVRSSGALVVTDHGDSVVQSSVSGVFVSSGIPAVSGVSIPTQGEYYMVVPNATSALGPFSVKTASVWSDGNLIVNFVDMFESGVLREAPVKTVVKSASGYLIPDGTTFIPVKKVSDKFVASVTDALKTAEASVAGNLVNVSHTRSGFTFSGPGASHIPAEIRTDANEDMAMLIMGALGGDHDAETLGYLAKAVSTGHSEFITKIDARKVKEASRAIDASLIPEAHDLVREAVVLAKEAGSLVDPQSVEALLSLNYVTEDNVRKFIDAAPMMEETLSELCELLIHVRLGTPDIEEAALVGAIKGLDKTVRGLKQLDMHIGSLDTSGEVM